MTKEEKAYAAALRDLNERYSHVPSTARWSGLQTSALAVADAACLKHDSRLLTEEEWSAMATAFFRAMRA